LLLIKPKWREHDESKWVGGKEFQSMMSRKDQGWQPLTNVSKDHPEPFIEQKVQFKASTVGGPGLSSSTKKTRRNLSSVKTNGVNTQSASLFRNSPNRSNGSVEK
jgi:hypothetical protein